MIFLELQGGARLNITLDTMGTSDIVPRFFRSLYISTHMYMSCTVCLDSRIFVLIVLYAYIVTKEESSLARCFLLGAMQSTFSRRNKYGCARLCNVALKKRHSNVRFTHIHTHLYIEVIYPSIYVYR